jgi:hypothetical protein
MLLKHKEADAVAQTAYVLLDPKDLKEHKDH